MSFQGFSGNKSDSSSLLHYEPIQTGDVFENDQVFIENNSILKLN